MEEVSMDLLDSVLRSADAEDYIETFRNYNVEVGTLPLLSDDDLKVLGIKDKKIRNNVLVCAKNLQIPAEKAMNITLKNDYVELVLNQISHQLNLHQACLTCAVARKDVIVCDIPLQNGSRQLLNCLDSFSRRLNNIDKARKSGKRKKYIKTLAVITSVICTIVFCKKYLKNVIPNSISYK